MTAIVVKSLKSYSVDLVNLSYVENAHFPIETSQVPDRGYALMFGAPGTFKTFLAIDIGLSATASAGDYGSTLWPEISDPAAVCFAIGEGRPMF